MNENQTSQLAGRVLFRLFGVPWTVTSDSWQFVPPKLVIGIIIAFLAFPDQTITSKIFIGTGYGLLLLLLLIWHIIGHTIGGKFVNAPMDENYITPILIETRYHEDPATIPKHVHLMRTLAGPVANLILAFISAIAWSRWGGHTLLYFTFANLVLVIIVILPFPTVDGSVIWRELRR